MDVWEEKYPNRIITCDYDLLVGDPSFYIRNLIQDLDFSWDDNYLRPDENQRNVRTASSLQVRKKIYGGSSNDWKKFEPYLPEFFVNLKNT